MEAPEVTIEETPTAPGSITNVALAHLPSLYPPGLLAPPVDHDVLTVLHDAVLLKVSWFRALSV
jgi:hypothetical protein